MLNTETKNHRIIVLGRREDPIIEESRRTCDQNSPKVVRVVIVYGCFSK